MHQPHEPTRRRRGRPATQPASSLAQRITDHMHALGLTQDTLAARLGVSHSTISRLLAGRTSRTRISPAVLADALAFSGRERARFLQECQQRGAERPAKRLPPVDARSSRSPSRRARRPAQSVNGVVGRLVQPLLDAQDMSRRELAAALGVKESTVSRMMNGTHATSYAVSAEGVSAAIGLRGIARRAFLKRAAELGAFALMSGVAPAASRYHHFDFAQFDEKLRDADRLLREGHALQAFKQARELESDIRTAPFLPTHKAAALRRIETALLVGRTQEAVYPWGERTFHALQTYQHIDSGILAYFAPSEMPQQYALLYERRAPLYRELEQYEESAREFTLAIDLFMRHVDDAGFLVTLYRNRAHVWAVQGDEMRWQQDLRAAEQATGRAPAEQRRRLEGLILYSRAEGYKRLARRVTTGDAARRKHYALLALDCFEKARFVGESEWEPHRLIAGVSEAQCLVWLDADEAVRQADGWRASAAQVYPSLLKKIDITIATATRLRAG